MEVTPATCRALMVKRTGKIRNSKVKSAKLSLALLLVARSLEPVELVVERFQADPEDLGRARLVVPRVLERQENELLLRFVQVVPGASVMLEIAAASDDTSFGGR